MTGRAAHQSIRCIRLDELQDSGIVFLEEKILYFIIKITIGSEHRYAGADRPISAERWTGCPSADARHNVAKSVGRWIAPLFMLH